MAKKRKEKSNINIYVWGTQSKQQQQVIDPISRYIYTRRPDALPVKITRLHLFFFCFPVSFRCCGGFYDTPHQQFLLLVRYMLPLEKNRVWGAIVNYIIIQYYSIYDSYIFIYFSVCIVWWWPPYVVWTASIFNSSTLSLCVQKNIYIFVYIYRETL